MNETWELLKMGRAENITRFQVAAAIMKESDLMFGKNMLMCYN